MQLTEQDQHIREAVIEFASCVYGAAWRERLAEVAGIPKLEVARSLNGARPLPDSLAFAAMRVMERDLDEKIASLNETRERVKALRREVIATPSVVVAMPQRNKDVAARPAPRAPAVRPFVRRRLDSASAAPSHIRLVGSAEK